MYQTIKTWLTEKSTIQMDQKDGIIIGIVLLFYGLISFWNLGVMKNPETFVYLEDSDQTLLYRINGQDRKPITLRYFVGPKPGEYMILGSTDQQDYHMIGKTDRDAYVFGWYDVTLDQLEGIQYLKLVPTGTEASLGEIHLQNTNLSLEAMNETSQRLLDESDTVPSKISYLNSTYFDEVYFARTAYEYANGMTTYEWVHPPLGKLIQSLPIRFLGMNPFSYRLMGNLSGILLILVMYAFGKALFQKRGYALIAALFMALDGFHFAQTRMGTIDTHLVLFILTAYYFMYRYLLLNQDDALKKKLLFLFLSGITIGCAIATKWTGLFAGLGLAILFFGHLWLIYGKKKKITKYDKMMIGTILASCVFFFAVIPIMIYVTSYFLFPNVSIFKVHNWQGLVEVTNQIYAYHSTLDATHPFSSEWYTWPLMLKPVWYYASETVNGVRSTISGIGNPIIWWTGLLAVIYGIYRMIKKDQVAVTLVVAFACLFLPYLKIGRCMFLYHYFPVLPFIMLLLVYLLKQTTEKTKLSWLGPVFVGIIFIISLYFFPIVSGMPMKEDRIDHRQWLPEWYF